MRAADIDKLIEEMKKQAGCDTCNNYDGIKCRSCLWDDAITLGMDGVRHILKGIAKRAKVSNVHPHRFRRTLASDLAARGMDIQDIQRLLGHTNINTTMRYVYVNNAKVESSYKQHIA